MTFLPKDENEPVVSNYFRFIDGENRFRVLSSAIIGWEYWVTEGDKRKPVRKRMGESIPVEELGIDKWGNPEQAKYFWAFVVWNYNDSRIQILEITQATVRKPIKTLTLNKKWGDPAEYDIVVTKSGVDKETEYQVTPDPKEKLDKKILDEYKKTNINLEALFTGDDPFASNKDTAEAVPANGKEQEEVAIDSIPF